MKKILMVLTCVILALSFMLLATACVSTVNPPANVPSTPDDVTPEPPHVPSIVPPGAETDRYNLVFEDTFDGDALDTNTWKSHLGDNYMRKGAYYTMDESNVFVKDGALTIRTNYQTDGKYGEGWYSGFLDTNPNPANGFKGFSTTYGYIEIACIAPPAHGMWSAFWLMPAGDTVAFSKDDVLGTAADGAEIDVMETAFYHTNKNGANQHALHADGYSDPIKKTDASTVYDVPGLHEKFTTFGVLWTEDEYIFNVNGKETWRTKHTAGGIVMGTSQSLEYLLLSVEVNGRIINGKPTVMNTNWSGDPDKNDKSKDYDFVIDYVKVYQLPPTAA